MTAKEAREIAFNTINTTFEEGLNNMFEYINRKIEEAAKQGELSISFSLDDLIKHFIKLSNYTLEKTVEERIKNIYEKKFFEVYIIKLNVSPNKTLKIDW